ncbi:MAG TPA: NAD-dependent epimerase/dehydratase family protein [Gaiellales bacterium]|jgi:nucleoside-diphosphate-sugar epimerase|nr:NAD-dependent epimerase/dehydratase family protein [Gaiellales bacterium]
MRIVVVGATGNVGSSLVERLSQDGRVTAVLGLARRAPAIELPKVEWEAADARTADLARLFAGADAVVALSWLIQPSHRPDILSSVNVAGTERILDAVSGAGVPALVYASSVGAYSRKDGPAPVDESWPTEGIPSCPYSRDKAAVERMLDRFQQRHPEVRTVRLRPALVFKRGSAAEITRYFMGWPALARRLPSRLPVAPMPQGLTMQCVHSHDLAAAYDAAIFSDADGAFNIAAEPVIDAERIRSVYGVRPVPLPAAGVRAVMAAAWHLRLQPTDPSWLDMALGVPVMDCGRAHEVLGWRPEHTSIEALSELYGGIRDQASLPTPSLHG